jgi:hypothetical protein
MVAATGSRGYGRSRRRSRAASDYLVGRHYREYGLKCRRRTSSFDNCPQPRASGDGPKCATLVSHLDSDHGAHQDGGVRADT